MTAHPSRIPVLRHLIALWRRVRRWFSRREWSVRLLNLPVSTGTSDEPGLILIQIDGLSRHELERALRRGRMPFLRTLLEHEFYTIHTMYPGQPTTTPAVLGELFYGVEQAVPAFGFRDHRSGAVVQMFQPGIASRVQAELSQQGEGLLAGGVAYCDIYSGGADDSSFCPATTGWRNLEDAAMWRRIALFLMNVMSLVRIAVLAVAELLVALVDLVRGITRGWEYWRELLYVPRRIMVNVLLRELVAISTEVDATRGIPVVHANFLGYDENAHRRGPGALFAHYALRGIDHAIERIWNAAHASGRRSYHVWIMSDHGQERVVPYSQEYGRPIGAAVNDVFHHRPTSASADSPHKRQESRDEVHGDSHRSGWLRGSGVQSAEASAPPADGAAGEPVTVAIGPLGFINWPAAMGTADMDGIARRLVADAGIPIVMAEVDDAVRAWTPWGCYRMPDEAQHVLAPGHPFLQFVAADFARLCGHPDAGEFVISGWRNDGPPLSFVTEHGAHGGPGPRETEAFVMLPADAPAPDSLPPPFRPKTLRRLVQAALQRNPLPARSRDTDGRSIRIATYNVHSCVGLDGRLSPARIARVLAASRPDIVALQELDVERSRTHFVDQARQIAQALEMELHFHPSFRVFEEQYGNAILSRFPMKLIKAGPLSQSGMRNEPRGALWVELRIGETPLQVVNTHLGLPAAERRLQIAQLLGTDWLQDAQARGPVVLCGDFNAGPRSHVYRELRRRFRDVQNCPRGHRPRRTWFSSFPLARIDHIFIGPQLGVRSVDVPRTRLSRAASDHLPLIAELELALPDDETAPADVARQSHAIEIVQW